MRCIARDAFISDWVDQTSLYFDSPGSTGGTVDKHISQHLLLLWSCKLYDYSGKTSIFFIAF